MQASVSIVSPAERQTVHDNTGRAPVSVKVQNGGSLPEGRSVRVVLHGERFGRLRATHSFQLESVVRGEHRLQVELVDESGKVVASSEPVTFYLWQSSRLF